MSGKRFDEQDGLTRDKRGQEAGTRAWSAESSVRVPVQLRGERRTRKLRGATLAEDAPHTRMSPIDRLRKLASLLPLVTDYANGLTQVQIAEKHGLHVQTVRKRLVQAGVDTRAHLRVLTDDDLRQARKAMKREPAPERSPADSASRTSQKGDSDQRKRGKWFGPSIEMLGPILG